MYIIILLYYNPAANNLSGFRHKPGRQVGRQAGRRDSASVYAGGPQKNEVISVDNKYHRRRRRRRGLSIVAVGQQRSLSAWVFLLGFKESCGGGAYICPLFPVPGFRGRSVPQPNAGRQPTSGVLL